jgi:hypothetical protein
LGSAAAGILCLVVPGAGKYLAIGLGIFAVGSGILGWRRAAGRSGPRLAGAAGIALGLVALLLGGAKIGLTILALDRLEQWLSPS